MNVGDVVIPHPQSGIRLASGCDFYQFAICCSVEPFILVSEHADMMWTTKAEQDFIALCKVDDRILKRCMQRVPVEHWPKKHTFVAFSRANQSFATSFSECKERVHESRISEACPRPGYGTPATARSQIPSNLRDPEWEWVIREYIGDELINETELAFRTK